MSNKRIERDSLGEVAVPADVHYGAQTQRARDNFPISNLRLPRVFIKALGRIKQSAAAVNQELGLLEPDTARWISLAAEEITQGKWDPEFVVDIFQTGSGTSTNMNANEIIASRANELAGGRKGDRSPIRPNDEVNKSQSSNDVIPTAIHLAVLDATDGELLPALGCLAATLEKQAGKQDKVLKVGRTHLQDAVPIRLGQEFSAYAAQVRRAIKRIESTRGDLLELPIGGTAVGTGINAHPEFGRRMCARLAKEADKSFREAANKFEALAGRDALVEFSGSLRSCAVSLAKIASDIRLLASGPRAGFGEINLPELQPGSSIMPGKVNPVMPEMLIQVCAKVIGNDASVALGGLLGQLELNTMLPLMAHNTLESVSILATASRTFADRCVEGISANPKRCRELVEKSLMPVTALVPRLGYAKAAEIAREAGAKGKTIREIVLALKLIPERELDSLLDLSGMTEPKKPG